MFKRMNSITTFKKGFTLIEIMVVIVIMGVLAAVAVPNAMNAIEQSRENIDKLKLFYLRDALNKALLESEEALFYVSGKESTLNNQLKSGLLLFVFAVQAGGPGNIQWESAASNIKNGGMSRGEHR